MVVFQRGEKDSSQYRLFKIKDANSRDDLAMLKEVVSRRLGHKEWELPNIVFVDGGLSQARVVRGVLTENNLQIPVVGLSKAGKHAKAAYSTDKLVVLNAKSLGKDLLLASKKLFQEIRDEAHRVAIGFQKKQRKIK